MLGRLFLLFTLVPVAELYLLITIGGALGAPATVGLVLATGIIGATLAKREGMRVLREWQSAVQQGRMPKEGITSSLLVLIGGVLLVTPGVLTDIVGLAMLVPFTRKIAAKYLQERVAKRLDVHVVGGSLGPRGFAGFGVPSDAPEDGVIDVQGHDKDQAEPEKAS